MKLTYELYYNRIKTEIASIDKTGINKAINNIKERMIKNVR